ncbi:energy transducer TonB [Bacterioplanoides sp. SCSIO 12839]|uniref:energy transducer TonB n=1 Tax=Bacterioplanoides sp. SCSIO 12839 TaxID=2829569 RepID=UPI002106D341|nr:TonB family protein [Bacterioplanoides sp. SCSIO 12839]UTW48257.1 energy transducer TonB [Bacterioplanoides sp. SCSIO 12839]
MTPLAGLQHEASYKRHLGWISALAGAVFLHAALAFYFWWQPESSRTLAPAAAPQVFEISMVAAPVAPATELPIDQQQQQSSPPPQVRSQAKVQKTQEKQVKVEATQSEIVLPQDQEELETPEKAEETPEENQQPAQQQNNSGDASGEQFVEQSSAPLTMETREAEVASAPQQGALNEQQVQAEMSWQNRLQAHLERRKRYPRAARMRQQQGVPWVQFTMDRQGKVLEAKLYRASGYNALDREVVALVKRAEPLPPPPEAVPGDPLTMAVPVEFFIR